MTEKIIIGMTGPFGSGCTYISRQVLEKMGYTYISLSDILREIDADAAGADAGVCGIGNDTDCVFIRHGFVRLADAVFGGVVSPVVDGSDSLFQAKDFTCTDRSYSGPFWKKLFPLDWCLCAIGCWNSVYLLYDGDDETDIYVD